MRSHTQIEEVSNKAKAYYFAEMQEAAALDELGLVSSSPISFYAKLSNLIFSADCLSLEAKVKDNACDELAEMGVTRVNTYGNYVEGTYLEEGYSN